MHEILKNIGTKKFRFPKKGECLMRNYKTSALNKSMDEWSRGKKILRTSSFGLHVSRFEGVFQGV